MLHSFHMLAATSLLCASAAAQGTLTMQPVTAPIRDAGVLDWATGTWNRASGSFANAQTAIKVFNNTCTWSGGVMFGGTYDCWQAYDEGRIPSSGDPEYGGLPNVFDCQVICGFEFSYCTSDPSPFNAQIGFVQGLNTSGIGGRCAGVVQGISPTGPLPPGNFGDACDLYIDGTGTFPGSPAPGNQACWVIAIDLSGAYPNSGFSGAPFRADGDCVYESGAPVNPDNDFDIFNWTFEQKGNVPTFGPQGPVISGGPTSFMSAGTYGQPSGTNPFTGNPCGSALGGFDNFWINVGTNFGPQSCAAVGGPGVLSSGCYFFGGYPGNPWSNFYMVMWASGEDCSVEKCGAQPPVGFDVYCTSKVSSAGCVSVVSAELNGAPTNVRPTSGAGDYAVIGSQVQGQKPGILFFGTNGPAMIPFGGGTLCMLPPLGRAPMQFSGGSTPTSCDGSFSQIVNDGSVSPNLDQGPGTSNWIQFWNRDPNNGAGNFGTQLSNAAQIDFQ